MGLEDLTRQSYLLWESAFPLPSGPIGEKGLVIGCNPDRNIRTNCMSMLDGQDVWVGKGTLPQILHNFYL